MPKKEKRDKSGRQGKGFWSKFRKKAKEEVSVPFEAPPPSLEGSESTQGDDDIVIISEEAGTTCTCTCTCIALFMYMYDLEIDFVRPI